VRHDVAWLATVRWATCGALWIGTAAAWLIRAVDLPLRAAAPFGLAAAICRTLVLAATQRRGSAPPLLMGASVAADAVLLTALVDLTGGPFNPFIVIYAVYVWLAAAAISWRWAVVVAVCSAGGLGWLVLDHLQAMGAAHHRLNDLPTHLFTMGLSGAAIAELVAHYVARARAALAQRQQQLDAARERAARTERLASLTTLAAGAAHELSTPLATIAVAARELEHAARDGAGAGGGVLGAIAEDARLIRTEVGRCQVILESMSGRARDGIPVSADPLAPGAIADLAAAGLAEGYRRRLHIDIEPGVGTPGVAGVEAAQALSSLLKNAFEASDAASQVRLRVVQRGPMVRMEVHDSGPGMSEETRRRAGEPFYTTKEPGRGLGLGLFLARTFAERSGGGLLLESHRGTVAVLELPAVRVGGAAPA
jgi:two-component system sensor histidine kinase RegB